MFNRKTKLKRTWLRWGWVFVFTCVLVSADRFGMFSHLKTMTQQATVLGAKGVVWVADFFSEIYYNFSGDLWNQVKSLREEVLVCKIEIEKLKHFKAENKKLKSLMGLPASVGKMSVAFANILNFSKRLTCDKIYIDRGSNSGILEKDVVVSESGIIGVVKSVDSSWSCVERISDINSYVSVYFFPSHISAILRGDGAGSLRIYLQEKINEQNVLIGQTAITDGQDKMFPSGILVGKVSEDNLIIPNSGPYPMGIVCIMKCQSSDQRKK